MDTLGEIMVYVEVIENKPQNQLVRMVFDKALFLAAYVPLTVGCLVDWVLFATTFIAVVPLFVAALGIAFVSDAIAIYLANVYQECGAKFRATAKIQQHISCLQPTILSSILLQNTLSSSST